MKLALWIMSAAALLGAHSASAAPRVLTVETWTVDCYTGDDEFAVRCEAVAHAGVVEVRVSTGDSQLFASAKVSGCPEAEYASWWRDEIAAKPDRLAQVGRALNSAIAETGRQCAAARGTKLRFRSLPDLANVGDPPPKWVRMHGGAELKSREAK
ncbi:hypothetical protein [Phenylobacterium sp.]|jgi:hypothetical protein|uniref:hypothetical protein n=1 Tax=Phenylobacterium sp. TaxID=1871053 RepID=UPI002F948515